MPLVRALALAASAGLCVATARELESHLLDGFSTQAAWSTQRRPARMQEDYASWSMSTEADGQQGSCLTMSFTLRGKSAGIWGTLPIEEPPDVLSLMVQNVTRGPAKLSVALVEDDGSNYVSTPVDLKQDNAWHMVEFPVARFTETRWRPDENGRLDFPTASVVLVVTGVAPGIATTLRLDELTTLRPRPARLQMLDVKAPPRVGAGNTVSVAVSLLPMGDVPAGTATLKIVHEGAVVSRTDVPSPPLRMGEPTTIGPVTLVIPPMAWGGSQSVVFQRHGTRIEGHEDGQVAEIRVDPKPSRDVTYSVKMRQGTPQLFEDSTPLPATAYMYERPNSDQIRAFAQAGVHLYWLECRQMGWLGPDRYDDTLTDEMLTELFRCDPEARVVLWFHIDLASPLVAPGGDWWQQEHPDELCRNAEGENRESYGQQAISFASETWRRDATAAMERFIRRLESSPFADRIVGYQPCAGQSYEWMYYGGHEGAFLDYSAPTLRAFRQWLRQRYAADEARLQAAWGRDTITFDNAEIPTPAARQNTSLGCLRDPRAEMPVIDYTTFFAELTEGTIDCFCHAIKRITGGTKIAGAFYGYVMEQAFATGAAQHTGHFALGRALVSNSIDFLMAPTSYWARGPGEAGGHMAALASLRLHGKLWLNQADLRTHLSPAPGGFGRSATVEQSLGVMQREFAMDLTAGMPVYWYCFSSPWFGPSEHLMGGVKRMAEIAAEADALERDADGDCLAVVVSDGIAAATGLSYHPLRSLVYLQREILHRSGVRFDVILDSDLDHPDAPRYKAYLFLDAIRMDTARRQWIDTHLKRDGRVLAWVWAQGISSETLSLRHTEELCGVRLGLEETPGIMTVQPKPGWGPAYGGEAPFAPVLFVDDETAEVVGSLTSPATVAGKAGLCVKRYATWTSVYSAAPTLSPEVIRGIAQLAGVHIWSTGNDPIYVGMHYVGIHAAIAGTRSLTPPTGSTLVDCFSGREMPRETDSVAVELSAFETKIYRIK